MNCIHCKSNKILCINNTFSFLTGRQLWSVTCSSCGEESLISTFPGKEKMVRLFPNAAEAFHGIKDPYLVAVRMTYLTPIHDAEVEEFKIFDLRPVSSKTEGELYLAREDSCYEIGVVIPSALSPEIGKVASPSIKKEAMK